MSILAVSVSHRTTGMDVLSQVAMDADVAGKLALELTGSEHVDEAVVLSTCNRTELYTAVSRFHGGLDDVTRALAEVSGLDPATVTRSCAVYFDEGAVAHAFDVAAGLDSLVVGESQILGQVRTALIQAQQAGTVGPVLNALFQQGIRVGKRVQTETRIGTAGRSLVTAALAELVAEIGPLDGLRVTVVGAGAMAGLAARTVHRDGAVLTCLNRTTDKAERLAQAVGGRGLPLGALPEVLADTDVVITCTGARHQLLSAADLDGTPVRGVIDLALPADVDGGVGARLPLVNLARLLTAGTAGSDATAPAAEVEAARTLVEGEVRDFLGMRRAAQVAPTVVALRTMASEVVAAEMARLDARLPQLGGREREEVGRTVRRVVEKLLHQPTVRIQEHAADPGAMDYAAALRELFALDPQTVAAVLSPDVHR
ncbi:glutamyl-tRNA reductase [Friedmanniella endophytica]|uniref:Glutamyl-tRNA reductase n=1 Tax=Microlunatus kandeliicorticis TaxID=1759536 RepID=A0A7W3IVX4_9ACTN|nr:glutamyl-tRNA reductase [Microlunatus kandeliicorticis]MBA8796179.1 glutamyl-tRNA reductase [Microlunatus kandeliicorticis]